MYRIKLIPFSTSIYNSFISLRFTKHENSALTFTICFYYIYRLYLLQTHDKFLVSYCCAYSSPVLKFIVVIYQIILQNVIVCFFLLCKTVCVVYIMGLVLSMP